jgi:pyruvate/2-oxoglutarate dehydrogenase complex dihydrolipoamide acyltransferase (E2) component
MPQMGESVAEGTITRWLKKVGDRVARDEAILDISTDKVDTEVPAPVPGILVRLLAAEGDTLPVGAPLAEIETEEQAAEAKPAAEKEERSHFGASAHALVTFSRAGAAAAAPPRSAAAASGPQALASRPRIYSPAVMRTALAAHLTLEDLDSITGTGFHGRVTEVDVKRHRPSRQVPHLPVTPPTTEAAPSWLKPMVEDLDQIVEMSGVRKRIAEHMVWSQKLAAQATAFADVDMSRIAELRQKDVSYLTFFCLAVAKLLKQYPEFNSCVLDQERILYKGRVRLGIAVAVDDDLFVPVIQNADELNFAGMARAIRDLTEKARTRRLTPDDLRGGTFTITNPGMFGGVTGTPIINQPQVAILGLGAIIKKPVVVDDAVTIRPIMSLSLTFDHRVIDGAAGFKFLENLRSNLENFDEG